MAVASGSFVALALLDLLYLAIAAAVFMGVLWVITRTLEPPESNREPAPTDGDPNLPRVLRESEEIARQTWSW